jgi:hypothetical protein
LALAVGTVQLPETLLKLWPPAMYPAQFWLSAWLTGVGAAAAVAVKAPVTATVAIEMSAFMLPLSVE